MTERYTDRPGILFAVCGESGSGKSTLVRSAIKLSMGELEYMNTFTTRPRRDGEDDLEYTFVNYADYEKIKNKAPTWDESIIYGNFYGLDPSLYIAKLALGKSLFLCSTTSSKEIDSLRDIYGQSVCSIKVDTETALAAERVRRRKISRDIGRIAIDQTIRDLGDTLLPDYTFRPDGILEQDQTNFLTLIRSIINERK